MKVDDKELEHRISRLKTGLKDAGVRMTAQRLEIFREVARSGDHPDAESIYKGLRSRMPMISLDTVYRTLWLLLDLGLINTLGMPHEHARFDANLTAHHHFVCKKCGMARDFLCREFDKIGIPASLKSIGQVRQARVEVRGVCLQCAEELKLKISGTGRKQVKS